MKIIITGPKASGKTTLGKKVADKLNIPFFETDQELERIFKSETGKALTFREIYKTIGENSFRDLEKKAVDNLAGKDWCIISTGGGTMLNSESRLQLLEDSMVILLKGDDEILWGRVKQDGIPEFLKGPGGFEKYAERNKALYTALKPAAEIVIEITDEKGNLSNIIIDNLTSAMMLKMSSPNTFGEIIRTTTFGESHGPAIGAVLDGIKPGIEISSDDIQKELNRRRPGQSKVTTARKETDEVHILSGIYDGKTTGTPICLIIYNKDQDSSKYDSLKDIFRPGHADFTFWKKFGIRDHRGGGRSSARETAGRVAAGSIALKILKEKGIEIIGFSEEIGGIKGEVENFSEIENNDVRAADQEKAAQMITAIGDAKKNKDSLGGIVKLYIKNLPAGLGDPVFYKIDARLAMAMFSIGAVKGVEFGSGFSAAKLKGSENNDAMKDGEFTTNNAGGILGGISNGQDIIGRIAVKPTPSIFQKQDTIKKNGTNTEITIEGRHDPCIVPRIIPIIESMVALVILDALEIQNRLSQ